MHGVCTDDRLNQLNIFNELVDGLVQTQIILLRSEEIIITRNTREPSFIPNTELVNKLTLII